MRELKHQVPDCFRLPPAGYLRLWHIIGDPGNPTTQPPKPPIPAIIPVSRSAWWAGVKAGRFPKPVKLGPNTTAWRVEDIKTLVQQLGQ